MNIRYTFRHLDKSEYIQNFAKEHVEKILTRCQRDPNVTADVKLEMENSPKQSGKDVFLCEIRLRLRRHSVVIRKRTTNMYEAISIATERLAQAIERTKGRVRAQRRKKSYLRDQLFFPTPVLTP